MEYFIWNMNPIAFSFGSVKVFWYGILFAIAILSGLEFMKWVYRRENKDVATLDTLFIYIVVGIVVGARLGHCLFYEPDFYLAHPMKIFAIWEGGLASHGGGLGVIIALYLYVRKYKLGYLWLLDRVAIPTALFGFFVRMGNFMNSEIVGDPTEVPWAVVFARVDMLPRHPAQLYESFSYLLIFFVLTYIYRLKQTTLADGFLFGSFLTLIFSVRFLVEFIKTKQADYDTSFLHMSTGQALSIPFLLLGLALIVWSVTKAKA
jgi:prolipoprotein diacylglyceryl transferase